MKNIILYLILTCLLPTSILLGQNYGNEWIDYSKSYVKIKVTKDGLHRVSYGNIENIPGIDLKDDLGNQITANQFTLYNKGQVVPYHYSDINTTNANGYIEFYGEKNDGEFDTQLYWDPAWQPNKE